MGITFHERLEWVRCSCGCVYQFEPVNVDPSEEYLESLTQKKFLESSTIYPVTTYFPLIEEMTFGRRLLSENEVFNKEAERRGWVINDKSKKRDCIISYHQLDKTGYFREELERLHDLLEPSGVLFLAVPDAEYIDSLGVVNFGHWFRDNKIIFSRREMCRLLEQAGFEVILARANNSSRFVKNNDMHIIAQRGL
jgi:predicted SAM-dependent methyltransferase